MGVIISFEKRTINLPVYDKRIAEFVFFVLILQTEDTLKSL